MRVPYIYRAQVLDADGREVARFQGSPVTLQPGETRIVRAQQTVSGLHFWSWGYGYLYTIKTSLVVDGSAVDTVITRTGFRKTRFGEGKIWLNDRVLMVHGYAQRTSNEWPGVGLSVPAWLSDYSNALMVESGGNLVRWMHVTPWKQDIKIFSTWYPTTHKFPWLMTDHCYWLSCLNENIGYNQPTNTGYYLGSDLKSDADAWAEAEKVQDKGVTTGISEIKTMRNVENGKFFDLLGRRVQVTKPGLYIHNGKRVVVR